MVDPVDVDALESELDPARLPRLAWFLSAIVDSDSGRASATRAAYELAAEASQDELEELQHDWERLRVAARYLPLRRLRTLLETRFGASWLPESVAEIEAVAHELERALAD